MKTSASFSVRAIFAMSILLFVAACGGGGGDGSSGSDQTSNNSGTTNAPYGSLTLSGTGTSVAGTTFAALSRIGPTSMSQWYSVDLSSGLTYPAVVLVVSVDNGTGITMVDFNYLISSTEASGEWVNFPVPPGTVDVTATGVTFTNLELTGYGYTSTTLTLNGTLTF